MSETVAANPPPLTPEELAAKKLKRSQHLVIFQTVLLDLIGFGLLIPIIQPFVGQLSRGTSLESYHSLLESWIMGIYSLMQFVFSPILGRLSDRIGRRPVIIASLIGSLIGYLILALATWRGLNPLLALGLVFGARVVTGICGASIATAQAYLGDITAPEKRTAVMGMIGAAFGLGFVLGPVIGGVTSKWGLAVPFLVSAALTILNLYLCLRRLPESLPPEKRGQNNGGRTSLLATLRHQRGTPFIPILIANFILIAAFSVMTTSFVPFTEGEHRLKQETIGYLFGFIGMIGILIQGGLIRRIAKPGREKKIAITGMLGMIVALCFLPHAPLWGALLGVMGLLAVGNSLATPTLNSLASQCGTVQTQGETMGAMSSAGSLGRFVGPFLAGIVMQLAPYDRRFEMAFWLSAGLMTLATLAALRIHARKQVT
jgi:MFS transporter, DHA1 family, tetracycline resistance protein